MTFPLEFDLLMIGVCTFKKKKEKKTEKKKRQKKNKKKRQKKKNKKKTKKKKRVQRYVCVSYLTPSIFFLLLGSSLGVRVRFLREMSYVRVPIGV